MNGLFCEKIFGPIKDFECACGKRSTNSQQFCSDCDVEFTSSRVRRSRLGYIQLFAPVVHIWYLKGRPSYLSILLNFSRKQTESLVYCTEFVLKSIFPTLFASVFNSNSKTSSRISKYRKIKELKNNLLLMSAYKKLPTYSELTLSRAILHGLSLRLLTIRPYLRYQQNKNIKDVKKKLRENYLGNTYINANLIQKLNIVKTRKKPFVLIHLRSFLLSDKYWELNLISKKSLIESYPLLKKFKQNLRNILSRQYKSFIYSYSSISRYFGWEDLVKNVHFIYYMTYFPNKRDFFIVYYKGSMQKRFGYLEPVAQTGTHIITPLLNQLSKRSIIQSKSFRAKNLFALERQIRANLVNLKDLIVLDSLFEKVKLLRRLKLIQYFRLTINQPNWMILSILPVLPPDLRPIIALDSNQIAISDLNKLYQNILFRNERIRKLQIGHYITVSEEFQYTQRLLQESIDSLIESGKSSMIPNSALNARPLKSLSDILKGKKGRFRQNLLGKRVDYSGRSVIVVGPYLHVHECGIPNEMAIELLQPFLIRRLILQKKAHTIVGAKRLIQEDGQIIHELLSETIQNCPILLNRAPTLHRLSIQAFQPKLVEGRAILLHPLVCAAFNADFDGDQMAVHVPLCSEARAEAWKLLWSQNIVLSPATGRPILIPTQDMVLGWYYLTALDLKNYYIKFLKEMDQKIDFAHMQKILKVQKITNFYQRQVFKNNFHVLAAYNQRKVGIHTPIWFYWKGLFESDKKCHPVLEIRLNSIGHVFLFSYQFQFRYNWYGLKMTQLVCTNVGRVLLNQAIH